jgi:subtilisin
MRFVMSNRRAGKFQEAAKRASREALSLAMTALEPNVAVEADSAPADDTARRVVVFDADPAEVQALAPRFGADVLLEPEIPHFPTVTTPLRLFGEAAPLAATPFPTGTGNTLKVRVLSGGNPLAEATVIATFRGGGLTTRDKATTNAQGRVSFSYSNFWTPAVLVVVPLANAWTMVVLGPSGEATVECPPLPQDGPLGWWHEAVGVTQHRVTRGRGIKVGVVDTGCGPHPALDHVTLVGAFIGGQILPPESAADVDSHGTHVCGTIGARPTAAGQYAGIAPGAALFAARVFPDPDHGANQGDIANAIDALSREHAADLINMSLGTPPGSPPSQIEQDAIRDALERGTLCIVAAGNDNFDPVAFPSRFEECVSVSALGLLGWGPEGSLSSRRVPAGMSDRFGTENRYLANFSNFGLGLDCCGPGVGVLATVPVRSGLTAPFAGMDGTSMASPAVCGALAAILAGSTDYKGLPRDGTRSAKARELLRQNLRDTGLAARFQGGGMPGV